MELGNPLTMSWASWRLPAIVFFGLALMGAPARAQPSAGLERAESLPPGCLAAGAISDAAGAVQRAEEILSALDGKPADGSLRTGLGSLIRNPDLAGVDLSAPVRFFYMNPQLFSSPWVYQFGVTDADGLKRAMAANRPEAQEGEVALRLEGRQATWSLDAKAAESLIEWEKGGGKSPDFRAAGQFQARLDVQGLLRAFDSQFAAEVLLMKGRAREALERRGRNDAAVEREISAVQAQLDSAVAALRQVREADFALELDPAFARVELDVRLMDSSPLRELFRAHAPGDLGLLGLCPPEASLVAVNNLSFVKAAGEMLLNMAGWPSPEKSAPGAGAGHRAVALFLSRQAGEPDAPTRVEILDLRDGDQAVKARQEWDRLARPAAEPAIPGGVGGAPFSLHPVSAAGPGAAGVRLAEIAPDEATLQPRGLAVFRRFLGSRAQAAQESRGDTCVTAIGGSPAERVRQAEALAEAKQDSLAASPRFQRSIASLPEKPNLLVYISPDALRRWFALGGRASSAPIPADAMGPAAGLTIGDGARFVLKFPTGDIPIAR
jgi:hypothetical protein